MLAFLVSAIRLGMAFLYGSTGETITQKSGHLNLGIPGVMCVGAAFGCYSEYIYFSIVGRNTSGVKLINIDNEKGIRVASIARVKEAMNAEQMEEELQKENEAVEDDDIIEGEYVEVEAEEAETEE